MPSSTLKRSAATLGVLAGLLAAAGPASAQFWEGESLRSQAPINVEPHTPQITNGNADDQMSLTGPEATASAQIMPGMVGVKSPTDPASGYTPPIGTDRGSSRAGAFALELEGKIVGTKAPVPASCLVDFASGVCYFHTVKAPARPTSMVFTSVSNVTTAVVGGVVPGGAIISA